MAVKKDKPPLSPREIAFCAEYVAQKRNGTRAYMAIFGTTNERSAATLAVRLLTKVDIALEIKRETERALKATHLSADQLLRDMSYMAEFEITELSWQPGEIDSAGLVAHVKTTECEGAEGNPACARPHVGIYKPVHEMSERARKMIKAVKFDAQGRKHFELWSKESAQLNIAKYRKLLTDKVEVSGKLTLGERVKDARIRAMDRIMEQKAALMKQQGKRA